jgi:hypothetical protein
LLQPGLAIPLNAARALFFWSYTHSVGNAKPHRFAATGVTLAAAVTAAATALAGTADRPQIKFNATDQAAAKAAVIRRADLRPPCCWTGGPHKPDLTPPTCTNYRPKQSDLVVTGAAAADWEASSDYLVDGSEAEVLESARMVRLDWQRELDALGYASCIHRLILKRFPQAGPLKRIAFPRLTPHTAAFQIEVKPGEAWAEFVAIGEGRTEISLTVLRPSREGLSAEALRLARILVRRAQA